MAPKLLSKMTKVLMMKPKRRGKGKKSGNNKSSKKDKEMDDSQQQRDPAPMINPEKPKTMRGSSSTTCGSSGYFSDSFKSHTPCTSDKQLLQVQVLDTSTKKPNDMELEDVSLTWNSSEDNSSCRSSPLLVRRPVSVRQRAISHSTGLQLHQQNQQNQQQRPMMHHNKSLSFRLRQRNQALSDFDFDHLLTMSRGWTFDPAASQRSLRESTHNRRRALASTDFDRYIFAPPKDTTTPKAAKNQQGTSATQAPPRPRASQRRSTSTSSIHVYSDAPSPCRPPRRNSDSILDKDWESTVHPFFRPPGPDENDLPAVEIAPVGYCYE